MQLKVSRERGWIGQWVRRVRGENGEGSGMRKNVAEERCNGGGGGDEEQLEDMNGDSVRNWK